MTTLIASTLLWTVLIILLASKYASVQKSKIASRSVIVASIVLQQIVLSVVCLYYITKNTGILG